MSSATMHESLCVFTQVGFVDGIRARWLCIGIPGQKEGLGNWRMTLGALMHIVYACLSSRAHRQWRRFGCGENMAPRALHRGFLVVHVYVHKTLGSYGKRHSHFGDGSLGLRNPR